MSLHTEFYLLFVKKQYLLTSIKNLLEKSNSTQRYLYEGVFGQAAQLWDLCEKTCGGKMEDILKNLFVVYP